jgi:hypothetical protein
MLEPGLGDPLALPEDIGFTSPPSSQILRLRAIFTGLPSKTGSLLVHYEKLFCFACILALLLPALLIVSLFSLLVARVLGVPLFSQSPHTHRVRLRMKR